jgi:hypothetical protein
MPPTGRAVADSAVIRYYAPLGLARRRMVPCATALTRLVCDQDRLDDHCGSHRTRCPCDMAGSARGVDGDPCVLHPPVPAAARVAASQLGGIKH